MYEFREKKKLRKILYSNGTLIALLVVFVVLAKGTWNIYMKEREAELSRVDTDNQVASLTSRQAFLENEVAKLKTENGIEREIREKYDVAKPGEQVFVIVKSTTTSETTDMPQQSFSQRFGSWFSSFFKK